MSWSSRKKKREHFFVLFIFSGGIFLKFVFHLNVQCIEYTFRIYIFLDIKKKKNYFRHFCCLFLNSPKAFNVSLTFVYDCFVEMENDIFWNVLSSIFGYHLLKNFALFIVFAWKALRFTTAFLSFFFAATFPEYLLKIH